MLWMTARGGVFAGEVRAQVGRQGAGGERGSCSGAWLPISTMDLHLDPWEIKELYMGMERGALYKRFL